MKVENPLTRKIIGCAMEVHRILGPGFQEVVYQRALACEFEMQEMSFQRESEENVFYKGRLVGTRRMDFLVEGQIMVELKAVRQLEDVHLSQGLNYLTAFDLDNGLLINFGARSLEFKRLFKKDSPYLPPVPD